MFLSGYKLVYSRVAESGEMVQSGYILVYSKIAESGYILVYSRIAESGEMELFMNGGHLLNVKMM